ncbi:MAG: hypothetical protein M3Y33_09910 [Actinomycetota bacterium]|nr:hypothetical protein [Actinomycetota bacterium]
MTAIIGLRRATSRYRALRRGAGNRRQEARWRRQRAERGWSSRDAWGLDDYLGSVISSSVTYLRDHGHGYPGGSSEDEWRDELTRIAEPLAVDQWRDVRDSGAERRAREEREYRAKQDALRLLADCWGDLWDLSRAGGTDGSCPLDHALRLTGLPPVRRRGQSRRSRGVAGRGT